jgi:mannose-6-phosphate isomerase
MAIEHAAVQVVRKPWVVTDLHPWSGIDGSDGAIGELWSGEY